MEKKNIDLISDNMIFVKNDITAIKHVTTLGWKIRHAIGKIIGKILISILIFICFIIVEVVIPVGFVLVIIALPLGIILFLLMILSNLFRYFN